MFEGIVSSYSSEILWLVRSHIANLLLIYGNYLAIRGIPICANNSTRTHQVRCPCVLPPRVLQQVLDINLQHCDDNHYGCRGLVDDRNDYYEFLAVRYTH